MASRFEGSCALSASTLGVRMKAALVIGVPTTAASAVLLLGAAPVQAQHFVGYDPAGDMVVNSNYVAVPAPRHHNLDIKRVSVRHLPHRIAIRVTYKALHWPKHGELVATGFIKTNPAAMPFPGTGDGPYEWEVDFTRHWGHRPAMVGVTDASDEEASTCWSSWGSPLQGMKGTISFRDNVIFVSYPRRCVSPFYSVTPRPHWIRVSVSSFADGFFDHWVKPTHRLWPNYKKAFYPTPRLYPGR